MEAIANVIETVNLVDWISFWLILFIQILHFIPVWKYGLLDSYMGPGDW